MEIKNTHLYEATLVATAFVVYVVQQLFNLSKEVTGKVNTAFEAVTKRAADGNAVLEINNVYYDDPLHYIPPIITGGVLLLCAWLVFHLAVWPKIHQPGQRKQVILSVGLVLFFIFAAVFLFHWYMTYLRYTRDVWGHITGLKIYSLYRKKTILGDAIGIAFLFVFYELVSSAFRWLQKAFFGEKESFFSALAYIVPFIPAAVLFYLALDTQIPTPLWSGWRYSAIMWVAKLVAIWALQERIASVFIPRTKVPREKILLSFIGFFLLWAFSSGLIWAANTNFTFTDRRHYLSDAFSILLTAAGIVIFRRYFSKEKTVLQQQVAGTSAELAQLRSQINPHFLFNALNSLYAAAMKEGAEKAADGIQRLGDMMRFMLQENNLERISVEKEVEYLQNYIYLQRLRMDETQGIDIKVILHQPDTHAYIAPMMLIPFVENAFKHGISHRSPSFIFITLSFDATHLYFRVQNSKHIRHENDPEEYQSGIGLQNVQKRLQLLYPGRHTLQLQETDHDYHIFLALSLW